MPSFPLLERRLLLRSSAAALALVALSFVVPPIWTFFNPSKLISKHEEVGTLVENEGESLDETGVKKEHEYDVIIVGGGGSSNLK